MTPVARASHAAGPKAHGHAALYGGVACAAALVAQRPRWKARRGAVGLRAEAEDVSITAATDQRVVKRELNERWGEVGAGGRVC